MTNEEKFGAKIVGTAIAAVVLGLLMVIFVVPRLVALLDDGHRAYPPSAYDSRR